MLLFVLWGRMVGPLEGAVSGGYWNVQGGYFVDKWGFAQCNCTSYVAYRINLNGFRFHNQFRVDRWGHGKDWDEAALAAGFTVNATPTKGGVAQWDVGEIAGDFGHVAYVEEVLKNSDGSIKSIRISQYNITLNAYSEKKDLKPGDSGYPPRFIDFRIRVPKGGGKKFGWFPSVSDCTQASQWFLMSGDSDNAPVGTATSASCPQICYAN